MSRRDVLLDACVVINLAASEVWNEVADANGCRFIVTRRVAEESQFCYRVTGTGLEYVEIDLLTLGARGEVGVEDLLAAELPTFVQYAHHLDDGEAETLAVAAHRQLELATDDLGAIRFVEDEQLAVKLKRTSTLVHTWASQTNPSQLALTEVLRRISQGARFVPPRTAPFADWWIQNL